MKVPTQIQSDRLILRMPEENDWQDLHAMYSNPECTKYTLQRTLTEGESWRMLATLIGHWHLRGYGPYSISLKSGSPVMGLVGLWFPNDWPEPEIKWTLAQEYWGQGIAKEAANSVWEMASKHFPDLHLISLILPDNDSSKGLAVSLGATLEKELDFRGGRAEIYRHRAPS